MTGVEGVPIKPHFDRWGRSDGYGKFEPYDPHGNGVLYAVKDAVRGEIILSDSLTEIPTIEQLRRGSRGIEIPLAVVA